MLCSTSRSRRLVAATAAGLALVTAGCGTRMSHDDVVRSSAVQVAPGQGGVITDADGNVIGSAPDGSLLSSAGGGGELGSTSSGSTGTGAAGSSSGGTGAAGSTDPGAGTGDGSAIVIGSIGQYSGPVGSALSPGARGLQAWAAATNAAGGLGGRKVEVIVYDDGGDGSKALSQVRELVEERGAVAVVASMNNTTLGSWRGYIEEKGVPVIGGDCALQTWHESPMLFSQCASLDSQIRGLAELGGRLGKGDAFGLFVCQEAAACAYSEQKLWNEGYAADAGLDPTYKTGISIAQPDFTAECIAARNAGVEILAVGADANTVGRVAANCNRQGYKPQFLQLGATGSHAMASAPGLTDALLMTPVFPFEGAGSPAARAFYAAWAKYGDGDLHPTAAQGWAAAKLFETAVGKVKGDLTSESLVAALTTMRGETLGGLTAPLTFNAGKPATDGRCVFGMAAKGGKWTVVDGGKPLC